MQIPPEIANMSDDSRVWIYQANKPLEDDKVGAVNQVLDQFTTGWTSHNRALKAFGQLFYNRFVVIFLDQSASYSASGCSIDKLVHFMEDLGKQTGTDFMDRMTFYFKTDDEIRSVHMNELGKELSGQSITENTLVFDSLVKTKKDWTTNWLKPLRESWHYRFV